MQTEHYILVFEIYQLTGIAEPAVVFKLGYGPGCQRKITDFMTINRKDDTYVLFYFNFNINI